MTTRQRKPFWQRSMQASKVRVALEILGVDLVEFETAYHKGRATLVSKLEEENEKLRLQLAALEGK